MPANVAQLLSKLVFNIPVPSMLFEAKVALCIAMAAVCGCLYQSPISFLADTFRQIPLH